MKEGTKARRHEGTEGEDEATEGNEEGTKAHRDEGTKGEEEATEGAKNTTEMQDATKFPEGDQQQSPG